jgi:alpha-tubulin suppressor-like RCC1 family protein
MRHAVALVLLVACGAAKSPSTSSSSSTTPGGTSTADGAKPSTSTAEAPRSAATNNGGGTSSTGGAVALVALSKSDPECALDAEGKPWRWPNGKLERASVSISGAKSIACSSSHTCVVTAEATVSCWGANTYGALGDGTQAAPEGGAAVIAKDLKDVEEVDVDVSRTCAKTKTGDVYCWGDREFAKAGDGTLIDGHKGREKPLPGKPVLGLTGASSLAISLLHACAATNDGSIFCWGQCSSGACGQPPKPPWMPRATKAPKISGLASLSAGDSATCGIDKAGSVACWGTSQFGILGESVNDAKPHDDASKIALPGAATEVSVGNGYSGHACARLATGAVHCWGHNDHGQLGDGTTTDRKAAAAVKAIEKATHVATGDGTACAIIEGGRLMCWGRKRVAKKPGAPLEDALVPVEITK